MRQPGDYPQINAERLWQRHMQLAAIGATAGGGVHRLALSDEDIEAHRLIMSLADARGFATEVDDIGNMFIRRRGADPAAAPAASGSHTDTQPFGGRFDGAFGVLAAFEALEAFEDAGIETRRPVVSQVDGDVGPDTPVDISVSPHRIKLIVPLYDRLWAFWPWKGGHVV